MKIKSCWQKLLPVKQVDGSIEVDTSGKKAGRGAYLCQSWQCWETGLKGSRLEHALRTTLAKDNRQRLVSFGEELIPGVSRDKSK